MHDNRAILENRILRELIERIMPAEVAERIPLTTTAWTVPGEPVPLSEAEAALAAGSFEAAAPGTPWGRPWGTTWFHATGTLPAADDPDHSTELVVELGFSGSLPGFQAEGAVYAGGQVRCGVQPRKRTVPLSLVSRDGIVELLVEAAANPDFVSSFRPNPMGSRQTAGDSPLYVFGGIHLAVVRTEVRALIREIGLINALMGTFAPGEPRRIRLQHRFQDAYDALDVDDVPATAAAARAALAPALAERPTPGGHVVTAVGHAHIDTAWLWPMRETIRKCTRTFANVVQLCRERPEMRFACSQAQQYDWIEQRHPELFAAIAELVAEGRWIPVGGMWVEADMNLPSGESLARQLLHGQRWFEERFGVRCTEVWIPDVFGYPGNLPQIFRLGGCTRFVTQKLSWNKQNRFPHNTFWWEGIDGSAVLAHFPPVDTYNAEVVPQELAHSVSNFRDHYWSDHSLMPFGYGDGGGGPSADMAERADLLAEVDGLPHLRIDSPAAFFEAVEAEAQHNPVPRWRGELYFEMHRGTFTSQSATKVGNRRCEEALRETELWLSTLGRAASAAASDRLDRLWKRVLTDQFHDIIPGSSIAWVHADAEADHAEVLAACAVLRDEALDALAPPAPTVLNPTSHPREAIVVCTEPPPGDGPVQALAGGGYAAQLRAPGLGLAPAEASVVHDSVQVSTTALGNSSLEVHFDDAGDVVSVRDLRHARELLPEGGRAAQLTLAPDHPVEFDAWDLEEWTARLARTLGPAESIEVLEEGPLLGAVRTRRRFGSSEVTATHVLRAGSARLDVELEVDWQESEKLLAVEFPLAVRSERAACEIQFGIEHRPTHVNTSWDAAKFEVCAHRFVDISEPAFGVAVLNDGRYGHSVQGVGPTGSGIRVSLLRAARYPDPEADRGHHRTTVALLPHGPGLAEVLAEAEALNTPLRVVQGSAPSVGEPLVSVDRPEVMVSAVKPAEDGSGDVVLRLWQATGDRVRTLLVTGPPLLNAVACDLLEEPLDDSPAIRLDGARSVELEVAPFQVVTLRLTFDR